MSAVTDQSAQRTNRGKTASASMPSSRTANIDNTLGVTISGKRVFLKVFSDHESAHALAAKAQDPFSEISQNRFKRPIYNGLGHLNNLSPSQDSQDRFYPAMTLLDDSRGHLLVNKKDEPVALVFEGPGLLFQEVALTEKWLLLTDGLVASERIDSVDLSNLNGLNLSVMNLERFLKRLLPRDRKFLKGLIKCSLEADDPCLGIPPRQVGLSRGLDTLIRSDRARVAASAHRLFGIGLLEYRWPERGTSRRYVPTAAALALGRSGLL